MSDLAGSSGVRSEPGLRHKLGGDLGGDASVADGEENASSALSKAELRFGPRKGFVTVLRSSAAKAANWTATAMEKTLPIILIRIFITDSLLSLPWRLAGDVANGPWSNIGRADCGAEVGSRK
jgi:hypothetical protein